MFLLPQTIGIDPENLLPMLLKAEILLFLLSLGANPIVSQVSPKSVLEVEFWDDDPLDPDDKLGIVEIDIQGQVIPAKDCTIEKIFFLKDVPKDDISKEIKKASVRMKIQWVPFDFHEDHQHDEGKKHRLSVPHLHRHKDNDES